MKPEEQNDIAKIQRLVRLLNETVKTVEAENKRLREQQAQDRARLGGAVDVFAELIATCVPLTPSQLRARILRATAQHLAGSAAHETQAPVLAGAFAERD